MSLLVCLCLYVLSLRLLLSLSNNAAQNAFVGWYQEKAAGDIVEQLKSGIALRATVIRNGQEHEMEAREIVPGDMVIISVSPLFFVPTALLIASTGRSNYSR